VEAVRQRGPVGRATPDSVLPVAYPLNPCPPRWAYFVLGLLVGFVGFFLALFVLAMGGWITE
jgi:hypothetical protein